MTLSTTQTSNSIVFCTLKKSIETGLSKNTVTQSSGAPSVIAVLLGSKGNVPAGHWKNVGVHELLESLL